MSSVAAIPGDPGLQTTGTSPARRLGGFRRLRASVLGLIVSSALAAGLLTFAPAAPGRAAANLALDVTFAPIGSSGDGTIAVTLPDGTTPVGSTRGAPTVIPAGYYTLLLSGPAGCIQLPTFDLHGPGVNVANSLADGTLQTLGIIVDFQPNATYTWWSEASPSLVYTFTTSSNVEGTPPPTPSGSPTGPSSLESSQDLVGSSLMPFRGTLTGAVSAAGKLTLAFKGKSVTSLLTGRYTITVTDKSAKNGFVLDESKHAAMNVTGVAFVGRRSATVDLTAGQGFFATRLAGKKTYFVVVG